MLFTLRNLVLEAETVNSGETRHKYVHVGSAAVSMPPAVSPEFTASVLFVTM